jgi:hydroxymethylpyrimidine/phosphomethylpyrimidine kinase
MNPAPLLPEPRTLNPHGDSPAPCQPVALTIAGSDSGGNAGIQADLRAFHGFSVHGCTAIAALTAQNPRGVSGVLLADAVFLEKQLDAIFACYTVGALKTGMLANAALIGAVAGRLSRFPAIPKVIDPVMVATSGARLLEESAVETLKKTLAPLATLLTPNLPEAEVLLGHAIAGRQGAMDAARELADRYGCAVLLKGGHAAERRGEDLLAANGTLTALSTPEVVNPLSTHGTGCTLSAAIAASLALGRPLERAVVEGKAYVYEAIRTGRLIGPKDAVLGMPARLPVEAVRMEAL